MAKKKKEEEGPISAEDLLAKIRKAHGASIIQRASEVVALQRIRTGIFSLDLALGGGLPTGRVSVFYGPKSSGKTTLLCKILGEFQKSCIMCMRHEEACECEGFTPHRCAIADVEGTLDLTWAPLHGVDVDELLVSNPEYGEQAVDIVEALLRSGEVHVVALDSIAFMTPAREIEKSAADNMMGDHAKLMSRAFRKWTSAMNFVQNTRGFKPTLLCTNQVRNKVGLIFGSPEVQPGGFASGFAATVEIRVSASSKVETEGEADIPVSVPISFKVDKNKTFGPKMAGEYTLWTQATAGRKKGEITTEGDLMKWGERTGTIVRQGNKWIALGEEFPTKGAFEEALISRSDYRSKLETITLEKALERGLALFQA